MLDLTTPIINRTWRGDTDIASEFVFLAVLLLNVKTPVASPSPIVDDKIVMVIRLTRIYQKYAMSAVLCNEIPIVA